MKGNTKQNVIEGIDQKFLVERSTLEDFLEQEGLKNEHPENPSCWSYIAAAYFLKEKLIPENEKELGIFNINDNIFILPHQGDVFSSDQNIIRILYSKLGETPQGPAGYELVKVKPDYRAVVESIVPYCPGVLRMRN